jgi:hypothetical protein
MRRHYGPDFPGPVKTPRTFWRYINRKLTSGKTLLLIVWGDLVWRYNNSFNTVHCRTDRIVMGRKNAEFGPG